MTYDLLDRRVTDAAEQQQRLAFEAESRRKVAERAAKRTSPPKGWIIPPYNTRDFWEAYADGWISDAQAEDISASHRLRIDRAKASSGTFGRPPRRWQNAEPRQSRQYANAMSTEAMHDSRLSMGAKALLVELRARCGKGIHMEATKYALALALNRSTRTIQRYLSDLARFGYIITQTRVSRATGLYTGLRVKISEKVTPFFSKAGDLAAWMAEKGLSFLESGNSLAFSEETKTSPKNQTPNLFSFVDRPRGPMKMESA